MSFSLTDVGRVGFLLSSITVTLSDVQCVSISGNLNNLTCQFPSNSQNEAQLPAGD